MKKLKQEPLVIMLLISTLVCALQFVTILLYKKELQKVEKEYKEHLRNENTLKI